MVTSALVCLREVKVCRLSQSIAIELTDICKSRDSGGKFQILELKRTLDKLRNLWKNMDFTLLYFPRDIVNC